MVSAGVLPAAVIKSYPLDERTVYTIGVGCDAPTTCLFPGPLTALEAANLSAKGEDRPPVLLSHQPGTSFFSVRALTADARAAANVVYRGRVYVLNFAAVTAPDRAVSFVDEPLAAAPATPRATPEVLQALIARTKAFSLLQAQHPALAQAIDRTTPGTVSYYRGFTVTVEEVCRFDVEDTLVLRLRFENSTNAPVRYDPTQLAVRVGHMVCPPALTDASGVIPARTSTEAFVAITDSPEGDRANVSVENLFSILVPRAT
ncbi:MAG: hypothetical protein PHQ04_04020 [Opitutaceae bacterium]|nr:hypothetical protein [Opitutaceae bacterium]